MRQGQNPARVIINVIRNRHAPQFVGDPYSKDVTEAIEQDAEIIVVQADDADEKVKGGSFMRISLWATLIARM